MPGRKPPRRGETGNGFMAPPRGAVERRRRTSPSSTTAASVVRSLAACARAWASNSSRMSTVAFTIVIVPRISPRNDPADGPVRRTVDDYVFAPNPQRGSDQRALGNGARTAGRRGTARPGSRQAAVRGVWSTGADPAATVGEALRRRPALVVELGEAAGAGARFGVRRSSCGDRTSTPLMAGPRGGGQTAPPRLWAPPGRVCIRLDVGAGGGKCRAGWRPPSRNAAGRRDHGGLVGDAAGGAATRRSQRARRRQPAFGTATMSGSGSAPTRAYSPWPSAASTRPWPRRASGPDFLATRARPRNGRPGSSPVAATATSLRRSLSSTAASTPWSPGSSSWLGTRHPVNGVQWAPWP